MLSPSVRGTVCYFLVVTMIVSSVGGVAVAAPASDSGIVVAPVSPSLTLKDATPLVMPAPLPPATTLQDAKAARAKAQAQVARGRVALAQAAARPAIDAASERVASELLARIRKEIAAASARAEAARSAIELFNSILSNQSGTSSPTSGSSNQNTESNTGGSSNTDSGNDDSTPDTPDTPDSGSDPADSGSDGSQPAQDPPGEQPADEQPAPAQTEPQAGVETPNEQPAVQQPAAEPEAPSAPEPAAEQPQVLEQPAATPSAPEEQPAAQPEPAAAVAVADTTSAPDLEPEVPADSPESAAPTPPARRAAVAMAFEPMMLGGDLLVEAASVLAYSSVTVAGRVSNLITAEAIIGATVAFDATGTVHSATTDLEGRYSIALAAGVTPYLCTVSESGYVDYSESLVVDGTSAGVSNPVALQPRTALVEGGAGADEFVLTGSGATFIVRQTGHADRQYQHAPADEFILDLLAGDDRVTLELDQLPVAFRDLIWLRGREGTDTVIAKIIGSVAVRMALAVGALESKCGDDTSRTVQFASFESVTLIGGSAADRLDASAYTSATILQGLGGADLLIAPTKSVSGTSTLEGGEGNDVLVSGETSEVLRGGAGDDRYVFGMTWGHDVIDGADAGIDTIDFSGYLPASADNRLKVTEDRMTFTGGTANTLIQMIDLAEEIDLDLFASVKGYVDALFGNIRDLVDGFTSVANGLPEFLNALPLLDTLSDARLLRNLITLGEKLSAYKDQLQDWVTYGVDSPTRLSDVVSKLSQLADALAATMSTGALSMGFLTSYRRGVDGYVDAIIDVEVKTKNETSVPLALGDKADELGLSIEGSVGILVKTRSVWSMGFATHGPPTSMFIAVPNLPTFEFSINASASLDSAAIKLGILDADITTSELKYSGGFVLTINDTVATFGVITLDDLTSVATDAYAALTGGGIGRSPLNATEDSLDATLSVNIKPGIIFVRSGVEQTLATGWITVHADPLFGSKNNPAVPQWAYYIDLNVGALADRIFSLLGFGDMGIERLLQMLESVSQMLDSISGSALLDLPIPLTGKTVGEVVEFARTWRDRIINPIFVSGNANIPDANGDGTTDLVATGVQSLLGKISSVLGAAGMAAEDLEATFDLDTNELLFSFDIAFQIGFGEVLISVNGNGKAGVNESQTVTVKAVGTSAVLDDTFRLGWSTSQGATWTAAIPLGSAASVVQNALRLLPGLGGVLVEKIGDAYTVTFAGGSVAATDVPLLLADASQLGNEFSLDFARAIAGDLIGVNASGKFMVAASLEASLTFGVSLLPDQELILNPINFKPGPSVTVRTIQQGGNGSDDIQVLSVLHANEGTVTLTYPDGTGGRASRNVAWNVSDVDLKAALVALTGLAAADIGVTHVATTFSRVYTITFSTGGDIVQLGTSGMLLKNAVNNGKLTGDAEFSADLFLKPGVSVVTSSTGNASHNEVQIVVIAGAYGGTFTLTFRDKTTTGIAWNATQNAVADALATLSTIGNANVMVGLITTDLARFYVVEFCGSLVNSDTPQLTVDGASLTGTSTPYLETTVTVVQSATTTNATLADLARDVTEALEAKLLATGKTLGFARLALDPSAAQTASSTAITQGSALFDFAIALRAVQIDPITGTGTSRTITVRYATGGSFALRAGAGAWSAQIAYNAPAETLRTALNAVLVGTSATSASVEQSGSVRTYTLAFTLDPGTLSANETTLTGKNITAKVQAIAINTTGTVNAVRQAVNDALKTAGVSDITVAVTLVSGKLQFAVTGGQLWLVATPLVKVGSGGGRISLSPAALSITVTDTIRPFGIGTRLETTVKAYDDPSYWEIGLLSAPTRFDGVVSQPVEFSLYINGVPVGPIAGWLAGDPQIGPFRLEAGDYQSIDGIVAALNTMLDGVFLDTAVQNLIIAATGLLSSSASDTIASILRSGHRLIDAIRISPEGNRIALSVIATLGPCPILTLRMDVPYEVPESVGSSTMVANGAITDLGFAESSGTVLRSRVGEFFLRDVGLNADVQLTARDASATAYIGLLKVRAAGTALLNAVTGKFLGISARFRLHDTDPTNLNEPAPTDPVEQKNVYVFDIIAAIVDGRFLWRAVDYFAGRLTGFFTGSIATSLGLQFTLTPMLDIPVVGSFGCGTATMTAFAENPDWLTQPLNSAFAVNSDIGSCYQKLVAMFKNLSFADIIGALRRFVDVMRRLDGSDGTNPILAVLDTKLPLVNRSVNDLLDIAEELSRKLDEISSNPAATIGALDRLLVDAFQIRGPPEPHVLTFDAASRTILFDFSFFRSITEVRPFALDLGNLDLGELNFLKSIVTISANGNISLNASIGVDLKLGLSLPATPGVDTTFTLFVRTGQLGTRVWAGIFAQAENLEFAAKLLSMGAFVRGGSALVDARIDALFDSDVASGTLELVGFSLAHGFDFAGFTGLVDRVDVSYHGAAETTLPLYVGTETNLIPVDLLGIDNSLTVKFDLEHFLNRLLCPEKGSAFAAPALVVQTPSVASTILSQFFQLPRWQDLLMNPAEMVRGLDMVLGQIQDLISGKILGVKLPIIGDALANNPASRFIGDFRTTILQPLEQTLRENNISAYGLLNRLRDVLSNVLGVSVQWFYMSSAGHKLGNTETIPDGTRGVQFELVATRTITVSTIVDLDLGIPALGLTAQLRPTISLQYSFRLGFGIDSDLGFYLVSDDVSTTVQEHEVDIHVTINLGTNAANRTSNRIVGRLIFLALSIYDGIDLDMDGAYEAGEFTEISFGAFLDLVSGDGRITLGELFSMGALIGDASAVASDEARFSAEVSGTALVRLHGVVDFSTLGPGLGEVLPAIAADFILDFGLVANFPNGFKIDPPAVAIANIQLDLGSFIADFAGPILKKIGDVLAPLDWLIGPDGFFNLRIPIISDLAGEDVTGKDLIVFFDPENGPKVVAFLEFVEEVYYYIDLVTRASTEANVVLDFGDLVLTPNWDYMKARYACIDNQLALPGLAIPSVPTAGGGTAPDLTKLSSFANAAYDQVANALSAPSQAGQATKSFTSGVTKPGAIEFTLLKADTILKLLLGQKATFFRIEFPQLGFEFNYRKTFPIIGPLSGVFSGGVSGGLALGFGYDSTGIQQYMATKNPVLLLNGFFLADTDFSGFDRDEGWLKARIGVGAAISLGVASMGVEGGIEAAIYFNFADLDGDGGIRFDELKSNILFNDGNPFAVFDIRGVLEAYLKAFIEIDLFLFEFKAEFELARVKLWSFEIPFNRPPIIGNQSGDVLTLNTGPSSAARLRGELADVADIVLATGDPGDLTVWWGSAQQTFYGVRRIVAYGGLGNDNFNFGGVTGIVCEIYGGDGNDNIIGGNLDDLLYGDAGADTIDGGIGNDLVDGGLGDDVSLIGGSGDDTVTGGPGNDQRIEGGGDNDVLIGGAGDDRFYRGGATKHDIYLLSDFGSVDHIYNDGTLDVLDFTSKTQNLTFFVTTAGVDVGWGLLPGQTGTAIGHFASQLIIHSIVGITDIISGMGADVFYITGTGSAVITIDGGKGDDRYVVQQGTDPIHVKVDDKGDSWNTANVIQVNGTGADDLVVVMNDRIILRSDEVVEYVVPALDANVLSIRVDTLGGDDLIKVLSTAVAVAVRIDAGVGDDLVVVGDPSLGMDTIEATLCAGLNKPYGQGPLVVIGGTGHDSIVIDDRGDATGDESATISAFVEKRIGDATDPEIEVEVGVVSGLGAKLGGGEGRVEFEGFEGLEIRGGAGVNTFYIGGISLAAGLPLSRLDRLVDPDDLAASFTDTLLGMMVISGGGGNDVFELAITKAFTDARLRTALGLTPTVSEVPGSASANETQTITTDPSARGIGYFTLSFKYQTTKPLPFGATARMVQDALNALSLIGEAGVVVADGAVAGQYVVTFSGLKVHNMDVANLTAMLVPLVLRGDDGNDKLYVAALNERMTFLGGEGDDIVYLNVVVPSGGNIAQLSGNGVNAAVTLDGENGDDLYQTYLVGGVTDSTVNVFDSGLSVEWDSKGSWGTFTPSQKGYDVWERSGPENTLVVNEDSDALIVYGTDRARDIDAGYQGDLFLLRAGADVNALAFIALLNSTTQLERVNYDVHLQEITILGQDGWDSFYVDDTRAAIEIDAGEGEDFFQFGQLYKSMRTDALAGIDPADIFATIETTKGWLSNGVSAPLTANGGAGDDRFIVFHNLATLKLNGDYGDDTFIVQAFALAGSQESRRAQTELSGDAGADFIQYAVNAPVNINGGDGFDTVIIVGTEFSDNFVVTNRGIFGAGLNVNYVNVEVLEVDGAEGNDHFFILSTGQHLITTVTGGLGQDFFDVNGPTPRNGVISNDLLGHSGVLEHYVTSSAATEYEGIKVIGITANVADNDEPMVTLRETDGYSLVTQSGDATRDAYALVVTHPLASGESVSINVTPPEGLVLLDPTTFAPIRYETGRAKGIEITFTSSNWWAPRLVWFSVDTSVAAGTTLSDILDIRNTVSSQDAIQALVATSTNGDFVVDTEIIPGEDPPEQVIYEAKLVVKDATSSTLASRLNPSLIGLGLRITAAANTANASSAAVGQSRLIIDVLDMDGDSVFETLILDTMWTVTPDADTQFIIAQFAAVMLPNVRVRTYTERRAEIVVSQLGTDNPSYLDTGGFTTVAEGTNGSGTDFIAVKLSARPDTTVTVDLRVNSPYAQLTFRDLTGAVITSLTFTPSDYDLYRYVKVLAVDDAVTEGFHRVDLFLTAHGYTYGGGNSIDTTSNILVEIADNETAGVRIIETDGSTNVIEFNQGSTPTSVSAEASGFPYRDSYRVMLTKAPAPGGTVAVLVQAERTRTSRTGGIRAYEVELEVSLDGVHFSDFVMVTFNAIDWSTAKRVWVRAKNDNRVDGSDAQVFATTLDQLNSVQGPLYINGGLGRDRTGIFEREPNMLPGETNRRPSISAVVTSTEAVGETKATVTIVRDALLAWLFDASLTPTQAAKRLKGLGLSGSTQATFTAARLVGLTFEVTWGDAKNKQRIITAVDEFTADAVVYWRLSLDHSWYSPFTNGPASTDPSSPFRGDVSMPTASSEYTLLPTNPNLLVKERDMVDRLTLNDSDNVNSFDDSAIAPMVNPFGEGRLYYSAELFGKIAEKTALEMYRLVGFGMGGDRIIGAGTSNPQLHPGGVSFLQIEQTYLNLGSGDNRLYIEDTATDPTVLGLLTVNAGKGDDVIYVEDISGHVFLNMGAGADAVHVADAVKQLAGFNGLLTVAGDTPAVVVETITNGSAATTNVPAVDEQQRITVSASGGNFTLSFLAYTTVRLPYNATYLAVRAALEALPGIGSGNVGVRKVGCAYRIDFIGSLAATNLPLIQAHDLGLLSGASSVDTLTVDDSGNADSGASVITSTSISGGGFAQVSEVQTILLDATSGTFRLRYSGAWTGWLPYGVSAAALQQALEALTTLGTGNVAVSKTDDVYVVRFQGNLTNTDVMQLETDASDLAKTTEAQAGVMIVTGGTAVVSTRQQGSANPPINDMQVVTIDATGGFFRLRFHVGTTSYFTDAIRYDATAEEVRAAMQLAVARVEGTNPYPEYDRKILLFDVYVERYRNVYLIGFQGTLRQVDDGIGVGLLSIVTTTTAGDLVGTGYVTTRMDGIQYFGFERLVMDFGSADEVINVQGTTAGSNGYSAAGGVATTLLRTHDGSEAVYISSDADLDFASSPTFQFLTGDLNDVNGALNLDLGIGRHKLMISDEAATVADSAVIITDTQPAGAAARGLSAAADIWITGLSGIPTLPAGGISYRADAAGNLFDGVVYWTGRGSDVVTVTGTHFRTGGRTTTMLNTGVGNDRVTVDLDDGGDDDFFVLHTGGGIDSPTPAGVTPSDDDTVLASASTLPLVIFGGWGHDIINSGSDNDLVFGDFGRVWYFNATGEAVAVHGFGGHGDVISSLVIDPKLMFSVDRSIGASDTIRGAGGEDVLVGGPGDDRIDGGTERDLMFGDNVMLDRQGTAYLDYTDPRYRAQDGATPVYETSGTVVLDPMHTAPPLGAFAAQAVWADWNITLLDHDDAVQAHPEWNLFGDDYLAGGPSDDIIFGQLGDDTIQGDGSIDASGAAVGASREGSAALVISPSFEAATDGYDYIEGGGGNDVIFGGLGQDDIVGGSSDLYGLTTESMRPDGRDIVFGGAGSRIGYNAYVKDDTALISVLNEHARDADTILGDNGAIYRIVSGTGYATYAYDKSTTLDPRGIMRIVPRVTRLLDYTPGGLDYDSDSAANDNGTGDELHGESGDDQIHGMTGDDVMYGESDDDDLIGGWGNDWISGGTGQDGILGDDGRIMTARNGTAEPLYGLAGMSQATIDTPGDLQVADIYVKDLIRKTVYLEPFNLDPWIRFQNPLFDPSHADDIIYGGLGSDFLHGGAGDDAISGAEALYGLYYLHPFNPGHVLGYAADTAEFRAYYEYDPWQKVYVDEQGHWVETGGREFLLNFETSPTAAPLDGTRKTDGDDVIFGDLGNDWVVGGTGRDTLWGGYGDDLLNADDNHDTLVSSADPRDNDLPDTNVSYEDRAYGGAGRDVLIANTGGDRLIDWVGEFNSYVVPYAPFGAATVSRALQPQLQEFLMQLAIAQGADASRGSKAGRPERYGEPEGELGMVVQKDADWGDQTGAPNDPQPGNIPGGRRDVLRGATFNDGTAQGFSPDSGTWRVRAGALEVAPLKLGQDAVSVFFVDHYLPRYYEVRCVITALKPLSGYKANAYVIFDYISETDFKFAGINISTNKLEMGHRDATGWHVDVQRNALLKAGTGYSILLAVNGTTASLLVDGKSAFSFTFAPRMDADGFVHYANEGMVGLGAFNAKAMIDNVAVQVLPPEIVYAHTETLDGTGDSVLRAPTTGSWAFVADRLTVTATGDQVAIDITRLDIGAAGFVTIETTFSTNGVSGVVFDHYSADNFKFAAVDALTGQLVIGHYTARSGWVIDACIALKTQVTGDHKMAVTIEGNVVSVVVDDLTSLAFSFFALVTDGGMGLMSTGGTASFASIALKTNDPDYVIGP